MKVDSIRHELMTWLSGLEDLGMLTSLLQFKKAAENGDWSDHLTDEQIESLVRGLRDQEKGEVLSSKDFWGAYGRQV